MTLFTRRWGLKKVARQFTNPTCVPISVLNALNAEPEPSFYQYGPTWAIRELYREDKTVGMKIVECVEIAAAKNYIQGFRLGNGASWALENLLKKGPVLLECPIWRSGLGASTPLVTFTGRNLGGHCCLLVGYNAQSHTVVIADSRGGVFRRMSLATFNQLAGAGRHCLILK